MRTMSDFFFLLFIHLLLFISGFCILTSGTDKMDKDSLLEEQMRRLIVTFALHIQNPPQCLTDCRL